jgi:hypothetical protein
MGGHDDAMLELPLARHPGLDCDVAITTRATTTYG